MYDNYEFFVAPTFEAFDSLSKSYENDYKALMEQQHEGGSSDAGEALAEFIGSR